MLDLKIASLSFTGYSNHRIKNTFKAHAALFLSSTHYAELVNCSFHENFGPALVVHNTNIILIGNSEFRHNNWCLGGAILTLSSNMTFIGNTTFIENSAVHSLNKPYTFCYGNLHIRQ